MNDNEQWTLRPGTFHPIPGLKTEEIELLAALLTASRMRSTVNAWPRADKLRQTCQAWRDDYQRVLREFIELNKAEISDGATQLR